MSTSTDGTGCLSAKALKCGRERSVEAAQRQRELAHFWRGSRDRTGLRISTGPLIFGKCVVDSEIVNVCRCAKGGRKRVRDSHFSENTIHPHAFSPQIAVTHNTCKVARGGVKCPKMATFAFAFLAFVCGATVARQTETYRTKAGSSTQSFPESCEALRMPSVEQSVHRKSVQVLQSVLACFNPKRFSALVSARMQMSSLFLHKVWQDFGIGLEGFVG